MIGRTASARNLEVRGVPVSFPTTGLLENYEQLIGPARRRFVGSSAVLALQSRADAQFLHAFLLQFCSLGARMTEPVEDWIRQASAKCAALGLAAMSRFLAAHAHAEAGHHLMMIEDVRSLAELWNHGMTAEEILVHLPHLTIKQVFAGLHYYVGHRQDIDALIAANRIPEEWAGKRFDPATGQVQ